MKVREREIRAPLGDSRARRARNARAPGTHRTRTHRRRARARAAARSAREGERGEENEDARRRAASSRLARGCPEFAAALRSDGARVHPRVQPAVGAEREGERDRRQERHYPAHRVRQLQVRPPSSAARLRFPPPRASPLLTLTRSPPRARASLPRSLAGRTKAIRSSARSSSSRPSSGPTVRVDRPDRPPARPRARASTVAARRRASFKRPPAQISSSVVRSISISIRLKTRRLFLLFLTLPPSLLRRRVHRKRQVEPH